jgi:hypothetical protein
MANEQNPADRISPVIQDAIDDAKAQSDLSRLVITAKENLCNGVFTEPRWYFDEITVPDDQTVGFSNPDAFKNGEAFPVKVTHVLLSTRVLNAAAVATDERMIQRIGVKLVFHGQEYMAGRVFAAAPLWLNKVVAAPNSISFGQAAHRFFDPWLLTARDTMRVQVQLLAVSGDGVRTAEVAFAGFGLDSLRPYWKSASLDLNDTIIHTLDPSLYRNDGDEPIVMTDMSATLGADSLTNNPQGDISLLRVQVNQVGNGTTSEWFKHATSGVPSNLMLAQQLGSMSGRVVVHELDSPIYMEPGEGISAQTQLIVANQGAPVLALALAGTIMVR